jgi:CRP/FNR family transcriptional regulator
MNLCGALDHIRLSQFIALGGQKQWGKGEVMFREGDPMGSFYKIREGVIAISRTLDDGRRQIVALRAPGDCVGYLQVGGNYAFQGEALTDVEACAFDRRKFDAFVRLHPDLASALAEALSVALKQTGQNMLVIGKLWAIERVAHFLCEISALYGARRVLVAPLTLHIKRGEIADYLGLTIETVSRSFAGLKKRNVIALIDGDTVAILDRERLSEIGKFKSDEKKTERSTMSPRKLLIEQIETFISRLEVARREPGLWQNAWLMRALACLQSGDYRDGGKELQRAGLAPELRSPHDVKTSARYALLTTARHRANFTAIKSQ